MFIIVLLYSFPLLSNDERSLLLFFGILFHFPVLFKIVNNSSAVLYLSPPPSLQYCFPSCPVRGLFFKALAQGPVQIEHAHIYTHRRSFQLSNYDTVLCQKKNGKSTLSDTFFLALIQILMQAVDRIWLLVGLMYLLDPPQDPPVSAH